MAETMGRNEYARHRGCAPNAVTKAVKDGRIAAAAEFSEDGSIKAIAWRRADELWAANTDPAEAARSGKTVNPAGAIEQLELGPREDAKGDAGKAAHPASKEGRDPDGYYAERAKRERFAAAQAELDYLEAIGRLVSVDDMRQVASRRYRAMRDKVLNVADRLSAILAAEKDPVQVHAILTKDLKRVLHELSDDAGAEAARGPAERVAA